MMTFAAARHERWGRVGVFVSLALMIAFVPVLSDAFQQVSGLVDLVSVCIAGLTVLALVAASAERWDLARHPRKLEVWGLNIQALPADGPWTFHFTVNGPAGKSEGALTDIPVLAQPGPPLALSWLVGGLPVLVLLGFAIIAWRRTRPQRQELDSAFA